MLVERKREGKREEREGGRKGGRERDNYFYFLMTRMFYIKI